MMAADSVIRGDRTGRRLDTRSRDVSHVLDAATRTTSRDEVSGSSKAYKMMERDLISIYKNKEILSDPQTIESHSRMLVQRIPPRLLTPG